VIPCSARAGVRSSSVRVALLSYNHQNWFITQQANFMAMSIWASYLALLLSPRLVSGGGGGGAGNYVWSWYSEVIQGSYCYSSAASNITTLSRDGNISPQTTIETSIGVYRGTEQILIFFNRFWGEFTVTFWIQWEWQSLFGSECPNWESHQEILALLTVYHSLGHDSLWDLFGCIPVSASGSLQTASSYMYWERPLWYRK